ncbi:hypothetical protein L226DRAFT_608568 [Lentinus tigrinus ALCF2SS1-7]|uniref:uncharacterized protein n=1 Tax=Lentinus tigrinus ALCF2SS1-7 TaxID=1328758 RepID=UPI001165DD40|nr:hypothetical protein L226DRAFT_608568 [Lentinus tigrinus ALCF2SS1-7]
MNNGNPQQPGQYDFSALVPVQSITPEQFSRNMAQIQAMKEMLARAEQRNAEAAAKYVAQEQERQQLQAIAEQGRLAEQRLAQLNSGVAARNTFVPPVAGPSTSNQPWIQPQYFAAQPVAAYNEVPTSARIVEVPQGSPQLESIGSTSRGGASQTSTNPHYPRYAPVPQYGGAPYSTANTSTPQTTYRDPKSTHAGAQQQSYNSEHRTAHGQARGQPMSKAHHRTTVNHYSVPQPVASTSGPSSSAYQSSQGAGPSSHVGGSGTTSATVQPTTSRTTQPSSNAAPADGHPDQQHSHHEAAQEPPVVDLQEEQLLYDVFKYVSPNVAQQIMIATDAAIRQRNDGTSMTAAERLIFEKLNDKAKQVVALLYERLRSKPQQDTVKMFQRVYIRLRAQAGIRLASTQLSPLAPTRPQMQDQPTQLQPPSVPVSAAKPQAQVQVQQSSMQPSPVTVADRQATHVPQTIAIPTSTVQFSVQPTQPIHPPSSQSSAARHPAPNPLPSSTVPTSSAPLTPNPSTNGAPAHAEQLQWYKPRDPSAPMAFRNGYGQLQFVFHPRSQQANASAPATQTVLSTPTRPPLQTHSQTSTTPAAQVQRATSSFSPQSADRRTLAHDIMRALLPLRGTPGTTLPPSTTPTSEANALPTENSKRKASPVSIPSTPSKRQRIEDHETDVQPDASVLVESKAAEADVVIAPLPPEPVADADIIDLTTEEPAEDGKGGAGAETDDPVDDVEQTGRLETIPVRAPSITSSDAADAHQVQEAIIEELEESSSAPASPTVRTTKSPSLGTALEEVNRLHPSQDLDYADDGGAFDLPEESIVLLSPTRPLTSSTSNVGPSSPVPTPRSKEKLPLFLPSRSNSPDPDLSRQASPPPPTDEDGVSVTSTAQSRKLFDVKGKGRQLDTDVETASSRDGDGSPARTPSRRRSMAYVLAPPLPRYAKRLRSPPRTADQELSDDEDELATCPVDDDDDVEMDEADKEVQAAAELSCSRLRETPCQWAGCGAVLNSSHTLQKHLALHAGEQDEWGSYACRWHGCLSKRFVDKVGLLKHLNKHALVPLRCAYEGCDQLFDAPDKLLEHHRSSKHRNENGAGILRACCEPLRPLPRKRPLPPLPGVVPAYLSVPCRVSMHPISKERHQWLGAKVLENIICFKWQGRRSNAAAPSRGSRRLAEKMAAAELAGKTPAESLALIKRWIDGEYLDLTDGYDASRRLYLHLDEIGSGEVTKMVNDGLVLFSNEPEGPPAGRTLPDASAVSGANPAPAPTLNHVGPEVVPGGSGTPTETIKASEAVASTALPDTPAASALDPSPARTSNDVGPEVVAGGSATPSASVVEATEAIVVAPEAGAGGPHDRADQLVGDVSDPDGKVDAGGGRLVLPRRSNFRAPVPAEVLPVAANSESVAELGTADVLDGDASSQQQVEER